MCIDRLPMPREQALHRCRYEQPPIMMRLARRRETDIIPPAVYICLYLTKWSRGFQICVYTDPLITVNVIRRMQ